MIDSEYKVQRLIGMLRACHFEESNQFSNADSPTNPVLPVDYIRFSKADVNNETVSVSIDFTELAVKYYNYYGYLEREVSFSGFLSDMIRAEVLDVAADIDNEDPATLINDFMTWVSK